MRVKSKFIQSGVHFCPAPWPKQWSLVQNAFEQWGKCGDMQSTPHWLHNTWIHYSCFTSMCVAKKDQSGLSASLCKLSRRCLDLSFMFLCQSRVNDNMIRFSSCFGGCSKKFLPKEQCSSQAFGQNWLNCQQMSGFFQEFRQPAHLLTAIIFWCKVDQPSNNTEIGLNPNNQDAINRWRNSAKYRICRNFSASLSPMPPH